MKTLLRSVLLVCSLAGAASAQHDYEYFMNDAPVPAVVPAAPGSSAPWAWQEARALFDRAGKYGVSAFGLAGIWKRVGETKSGGGAIGSVNLAGFDVEGLRGRMTITLPPENNPFTSLPKVVVQGENQTALVEAEKSWDFKSASVIYSCRMINADNMICTVGPVFLAYTR